MASIEISSIPVMHSVSMGPFEVPVLDVEKAVKAVQNYNRELEESEAKNQPC